MNRIVQHRPRKIRADRGMRKHCAFTLIEIAVAVGMLAVLLFISAQMLRAMSNYQHTNRQRTVALQAIQAVSEQAGNIRWDQLSTDSAQQIKIPNQLEVYLPNASLSIVVEEESAPVVCKRIMAELKWRGLNSQTVAPVRLTSWAFPPVNTDD